jgi:hypothetical protein
MSISQNFPEEGPTLNLNFAGSRTLDPRITFTRTSSATYMGRDGLVKIAPANSARFDHLYNSTTGEVESLGLLVEEARTNLITYSEDFGTDWVTIVATTNTNNSISPDGTLTADQIVSTGGGVYRAGVGIQSNTTYTYSVYVKYVSGNGVLNGIGFEKFGDTFVNGRSSFDIINGTIVSNGSLVSSSSITPISNGWYRLSVTSTSTNTSTTITNYSTPTTFLIWGAQLEQGAFPTSYIPTTTSTVTRTADNASITGSNFSDFYNPSEGTLITNVNLPFRILTGARSFALDDGTTSYMIDLTNTTNSVTLEGLENSSYTNIRTISNSTSKIMKQATSFNSSNQTISVNGEVTTPSSTSLSISRYKNLRIASQVNNSAYLNGYIQQLVYYPTALPSNQLITLTK